MSGIEMRAFAKSIWLSSSATAPLGLRDPQHEHRVDRKVDPDLQRLLLDLHPATYDRREVVRLIEARKLDIRQRALEITQAELGAEKRDRVRMDEDQLAVAEPRSLDPAVGR